MELQAFEIQFVRKLKPEAAKWLSIGRRFLLFLNCFRANQIGSEQVFGDLTFKHRDALRKQIDSLVDYVLNLCFGYLQC